jgi:mannose-6-phosphate isomerase
LSLHEVPVSTGDIIFVPAGTVHAIGKGVLLYELQEYSDLTYRLYDYGRLTSTGIPRELHIERSLDVLHYDPLPCSKMQPLPLQNGDGFKNRCLAACQYFVTCELILHKTSVMNDYMKNKTHDSCIIFISLGAEISVRYGETLDYAEKLFKGQTMILPAELGTFCLEGSGTLLYSYVPASEDEIWHEWEAKNGL